MSVENGDECGTGLVSPGLDSAYEGNGDYSNDPLSPIVARGDFKCGRTKLPHMLLLRRQTNFTYSRSAACPQDVSDECSGQPMPAVLCAPRETVSRSQD